MTQRLLSCIAFACAALAPALSHSQARIAPAPQPARQAPPPGVATFGLPNPSGLASPAPAQLTPPGAPSLTPPDVPNLASPGTAPGSAPIDTSVAAPTAGGVSSAGQLYGAGVGTAAMGAGGIPRGPYSAVDIARNFMDADINRDGALSRAEAQRLAIPVPFEDLDRNRDGMLTRFEYEDFFR
jgi:hypothetical protein